MQLADTFKYSIHRVNSLRFAVTELNSDRTLRVRIKACYIVTNILLNFIDHYPDPTSQLLNIFICGLRRSQ